MSSRGRRDLPRTLHPAAGGAHTRYRADQMYPVRSVQRLLPASVRIISVTISVVRQPSLFYSSALRLLASSRVIDFCSRCIRLTSPANEYAIRAVHRRAAVNSLCVSASPTTL